VDRTTVEAYLNAEYPELIVDAAITSLETVLDQVDATLTARPDVSVAWQYGIADYFLLKRIRAVYAVNFDVSGDGESYSLNQQYRNVDAMFTKAAAKVGWIVDPVVIDPDTEGIGKLVTITAPYLSASAFTGGDEWS